MSGQEELFTVPELEPEPVLTRGERMQRLHAERVARGAHPLSMAHIGHIPLHPDAAPFGDREADGLRCGTCVFRRHMHGGSRSYPKCTRTPLLKAHSAASDCRAYWPACIHYQPAET